MKTSKQVIDSRVERIAKAVIKGVPSADIVETFVKSEGVTRATVYVYIEQARELIKETAKDKSDIEYQISLSVLRLDKLYFMNEKANNYPECRAVLESKAKMLGFNAPTKTELTGKDGQPLNPNKIELDYSKLSDSVLQSILDASA
jgi:hypothetical protein